MPSELPQPSRAQLADAKLQLDFAHNYLMEIQIDLESGGPASQDTKNTYEHALRALLLAIETYRSVLSIFSAAVLPGTVRKRRG